MTEWHDTHQKELKEYRKRWYQEHKEEQSRRYKEFRKKPGVRERDSLKHREYRKLHPGMDRERLARRAEAKRQFILSRGGGCSVCGYNRNMACLDLHHLDPKEKEHGPSKLFRNPNSEKTKTELAKCVVVCRNCHGEIHHPS